MHFRRVNFDRELERGRVCYEEKVGKWWHTQATNGPHQAAYRRIADFVREVAPRNPELIIDYACGSGQLLRRLPRRFPTSRILGLDGSALMLKMAREAVARLGKTASEQTEFTRTALPNFSLPRGKADMVVFIFPNIVLSPRQAKDLEPHRPKHRGTNHVAKHLAAAREPDPEDETDDMDEETVLDTLLDDNLISWHVRSLLKPGGLCIRAEYCNSHRREFTNLVRRRKSFEEGSLKFGVNGKANRPYFRYVKSRYTRSKVIEDVFHQTRDEEDHEGGYEIALLKAL